MCHLGPLGVRSIIEALPVVNYQQAYECIASSLLMRGVPLVTSRVLSQADTNFNVYSRINVPD